MRSIFYFITCLTNIRNQVSIFIIMVSSLQLNIISQLKFSFQKFNKNVNFKINIA